MSDFKLGDKARIIAGGNAELQIVLLEENKATLVQWKQGQPVFSVVVDISLLQKPPNTIKPPMI